MHGGATMNQLDSSKRFADKTFIYLEIKLIIISSGKHRAQESLFLTFLKETKMQIRDALAFLWREICTLRAMASGEPEKSSISGCCFASILNAVYLHRLLHEHTFIYVKGEYRSEG